MWSDVKGSDASIFFEIKDASALEVIGFEASEHLSSPFFADVILVGKTQIQFDSVTQKEALLIITSDRADRYIHGIVRKFEHIGISGEGKDKGKYIYRVEIVPFTQLLSLEQDCRIFQNKNVQDIVADIF
ncbi:MAG: contractile injection system protein, VgrG/Pvc8 family, partial [Smithella sp.]